MTLVRQKGILVDSNNQPVKNRLKELRKHIDQTKDKDEKGKFGRRTRVTD